jgi:hypothetical protein
MTKYYVDAGGNYLGGFDGDGVAVPAGAIEVAAPPSDGRQKWVNNAWSVLDQDVIDLQELNAALAAPGSLVRALGLVTFQEINKLRVRAGLTAYTMDQFMAALKANLR